MDLLSDEIVLIIIKYLDNKSILAISRLNKKFNNLAFDKSVWQGRAIIAQPIQYHFNTKLLEAANVEINCDKLDINQWPLLFFLKNKKARMTNYPTIVDNICPKHAAYSEQTLDCDVCGGEKLACCIQYIHDQSPMEICNDCIVDSEPWCDNCRALRSVFYECTVCAKKCCSTCSTHKGNVYLCKLCGNFCAVCNEIVDAEFVRGCYMCKSPVCQNHQLHVFCRIYCTNCTEICANCHEDQPEEISGKCFNCARVLCRGCMRSVGNNTNVCFGCFHNRKID